MKGQMMFAIILFVLLVGSLGTNIYTQYQLSELNRARNTQIENLQKQLDLQKKSRDRIRDIWEDQAAANDELVLAQNKVDQKIEAYEAEIRKSIRFINTVPQILPDANEANLKKVQTDLSQAQTELDQLIRKNADLKSQSKQKVDTIYLELNEDQTNRANPREGTR